jgi:hypothetical protein
MTPVSFPVTAKRASYEVKMPIVLGIYPDPLIGRH